MKKAVKILFILILGLLLSFGLISTLFKPVDIMSEENRFANKMPKLSWHNFINGEFQSNIELALADQLPLSGKLKVLKKTMDLTLKSVYYLNAKEDSYIPISDGIYKFNDYLVYNKYNFEDVKDGLDSRINNINDLAMYVDNEIYLYYIEKDTDIDFTNNSKLGVYEYMKDELNKKVISSKFDISNFDDFKNSFYKVDHHWNYKGSYKAYKEVAKLLGINDTLNYDDEICLDTNLIGSKNSAVGGRLVFTEKLCSYTYSLPNYDIYAGTEKISSYGNYESVNKNKPISTRYEIYYGEDYGELKIDNHDNSKENLLIIGESYDNAITLLLASHFNITYNIDLRYYYNIYYEYFDIKSYIRENNISKVLLIGNIDYYTKELFNIGSGA